MTGPPWKDASEGSAHPAASGVPRPPRKAAVLSEPSPFPAGLQLSPQARDATVKHSTCEVGQMALMRGRVHVGGMGT